MVEAGYKVELSPRALRDLEEVVRFIAADNPQAAERFGNQLIDEAEAIGPHPLAGPVVREFNDPKIRERIFRAYRIVYRVDEERKLIVVSRFWHAARDKPQI
jgi:addiction module RelE/StbE family toxin